MKQLISNVLITNVRDGSFVVSWVTDTATDGHVDWGTSTPPGTTTSDSVVSTTTHYVTISGLSPNTTYFFQVRSGSTTDDNGGAYYSVTTGPNLLPPAPGRVIFGTVYQSNGSTPVPNAIVYIRVRDNDGGGSTGNSQWAAARTDGTGIWFLELNNLRTEDYSAFFSFSNTTDNLQGVWQGGVYGLVGEVGDEQIFPVPSTYPTQIDMTLDEDPTAIRLSSLEAVSGQNESDSVILFLTAVGAILLSIIGLNILVTKLGYRPQ